MRVPVVDKNGNPLMPTKCSKARKLVRAGLICKPILGGAAFLPPTESGVSCRKMR